MRREEQMSIQLEGGGDSDIITVSPVLEHAGVRFAPIGLPHMLNTGGAVVSCKAGERQGGPGGPANFTDTLIHRPACLPALSTPAPMASCVLTEQIHGHVCCALRGLQHCCLRLMLCR